MDITYDQPSTVNHQLLKMAKFPNITLAILAGGKASRMRGQNKALLEIDGESFIKRIHRNLGSLYQNTIIISNDVKDFNIPSSIVLPDIIGDIGPLGGIHSALVNSNDPFVFIVSCDMPFVDPFIAKIITEEFLIKQPDVLIPVIDSYSEPLFALYSKKIIGKIEPLAMQSSSVPIKDILKEANILFFNLPNDSSTKRCFVNINSLDDIKLI